MGLEERFCPCLGLGYYGCCPFYGFYARFFDFSTSLFFKKGELPGYLTDELFEGDGTMV